MHGGAAMLILIRDEARARHLAIEDMVERAYWGQLMTSLRRGLDESQRQARVRH
jgi:hypothetical protein